jgi:hypothetical protein
MTVDIDEDNGDYLIRIPDKVIELLDWEFEEELDYYIDEGNLVIFAV